MAHAWVEVLVKALGRGQGPAHEWLTLDPTPGAESAREPSPVVGWWKDKTSAGASMWQRLIVGYDAQRQGEVLSGMAVPSVIGVIVEDSLKYVVPVLLGLAVVIGYLFVRVRRSRRPIPAMPAGSACYARLVRILARRGKLKLRWCGKLRASWRLPPARHWLVNPQPPLSPIYPLELSTCSIESASAESRPRPLNCSS